MSTFLELVQDLHRESGAAGQSPTTVLNQRGEYQRLVRWTRDADLYVQKLWENWKFMRQEYSEVTAIGSNDLPVATDAAWYDEDTFKIIQSGETLASPIEVVEYDSIKSEVRDTDNGVPYRVVLMPDITLEVDPPADAAHTITGDYYQNPVPMVNNTDVSVIPARFQEIIIGRGLVLYANYEGAPEIKTQGSEIYTEQLARLENDQLPNQFSSRYRTGGGFEVIAE